MTPCWILEIFRQSPSAAGFSEVLLFSNVGGLLFLQKQTNTSAIALAHRIHICVDSNIKVKKAEPTHLSWQFELNSRKRSLNLKPFIDHIQDEKPVWWSAFIQIQISQDPGLWSSASQTLCSETCYRSFLSLWWTNTFKSRWTNVVSLSVFLSTCRRGGRIFTCHSWGGCHGNHWTCSTSACLAESR